MKIDVGVGGVFVAAIAAFTTICVHRDAQNASLKRRELDHDITTAMQNAVDGMGRFSPSPSYWDEEGIVKD